jgi:hypothetical protein
MNTVEEIIVAIEGLSCSEQVRLLRELPCHLKTSLGTTGAVTPLGSVFDFWNNPDDSLYDGIS